MVNDHAEIEKRLWEAAAPLRGTMQMHEVYTLALGLVFLRYLDHQFSVAEKTLSGESTARTPVSKYEYTARGIFYVPPQARFSALTARSSYPHVTEAVNLAVRSLESENDSLRDILPEISNRIDHVALVHMLSILADVPNNGECNLFAHVFETLLNNFARSAGQSGWEFSTRYELATLLVELAKPAYGMTVYDPCVGVGGMLLATAKYLERSHRADTQLLLYGQESNAQALAICKMRLFINGVNSVNIQLGNTLWGPKYLSGDRLTAFDIVISNPPISLSPWHHGEAEHDPFNRFKFGVPPKSNADFAFIQHMLASASPKGLVVALVSHGVLFRGGSEGRIRQEIIEADLVEAVIGLPPGLLFGSEISAAVLLLNKSKSRDRQGKTLFIDASQDFAKPNRHNSIRPDDVARIVSTFDAFSNVERYARVIDLAEIRQNAFNLNIPRYADSSPLTGLVTQYSQYEKYTLKELASEINSVGRNATFKEKENAVYIPITGSRRSVERLDQLEASHNSYFQIVLCEKAINGYVAQFFRSSVGQHALSVLAQGSAVRRINKTDIKECMIAVPSLDIQREIISMHQKLTSLKEAIANLDQELSLNPTGQPEFMRQVDSMLAVIGRLSDADYVLRIIREGESKTVEFKQTFSLDIKKQTKEPYIETSALKTLVAFLNSDGGRLLIGVGDDETVIGVNVEIKKFHKDSLDNFLKHFKNSLKSRIGEEFYPFINYRTFDVKGCKVLVVECEPSKSPCFLNGIEFYVRTNPATDRLEGPKFLEYVKHRFQS